MMQCPCNRYDCCCLLLDGTVTTKNLKYVCVLSISNPTNTSSAQRTSSNTAPAHTISTQAQSPPTPSTEQLSKMSYPPASYVASPSHAYTPDDPP
mmetsp:Transcript_25649/g.48876  ORF Transcript_25649/g.48876 Transcript_25649/m.48876 type:complete len:95 (+) Transcript_25649:172-456(+)